jgi:small neutral amino acid transporter SnatA (MarC family)
LLPGNYVLTRFLVAMGVEFLLEGISAFIDTLGDPS